MSASTTTARALSASLIKAFYTRTTPLSACHLAWTGARDHHGTPVIKHHGDRFTAARLAYLIHHGTEPIGYAKPGCRQTGCVTPAHQIDTVDRRRPHVPHVRYESAEAKLAALTEPTDDGHVVWVGPVMADGRRLLSFGGFDYRAARIAFRARWGREPIGAALPGCGFAGCLLGDHLDDKPARDANRVLFTAVFGRAA